MKLRQIHKLSLGILLAAVLIAPFALKGGAQAATGAGTSTLSAGQILTGGQQLVSASGQYTATLETNGELVVSGNGCTIWASGYFGSSPSLILQPTDGNLVVYATGGAIWASGSGNGGNNTGDSLVMQDDGNLVVYGPSGALWGASASKANQLCTNGTMRSGQYIHSPSGQYQLYVGGDGKLVVYNNGTAQWESMYYGQPSGTYTLDMQGTDGNLVVYGPSGNTPWSSGTGTAGAGANLVMQNDGNLVIYNSAGRAVWSTGTIGNVKALTWAMGQIGQSGWGGRCLEFVNQAYGSILGKGSFPDDYWSSNPKGYTKHPTSSYSPAPPAGALVFWGQHFPNNTGGNDSHVAISLGNGAVVSTPAAPSSGSTVFTFNLSQRSPTTYNYLGWMMPGN